MNVGLKGCVVGAIDCMKFKWKKFPSKLKGKYHSSKEGNLATIKVEAWTDHDLYRWNWFSGRCGTNNDKTMVAMSPLFREILCVVLPYKQQNTYTKRSVSTVRDVQYLLAEDIYKNWPILVKPINFPSNDVERKFTVRKEVVRKDAERCFGVLQERFRVLRLESYLSKKDTIV